MAETPKSEQIAAIVEGPVDYPEMFADSAEIQINPYGVNLVFGVTHGEQPTKRVVGVRMSPQHALVLTQLLRKNLKTYETKVGKIELPDGLYKGLQIEKEL
jgi:hypothetical protein